MISKASTLVHQSKQINQKFLSFLKSKDLNGYNLYINDIKDYNFSKINNSLDNIEFNRMVQSIQQDILLRIQDHEYDGFKNAASYYLSHKSKFIRSQLILLSALGREISQIDQLKLNNTKKWAQVVEIIHNSSLYQDDIFDNARIRRDNQTAHLKFGIKKAVLTPVYLTSMAGQIITEIGDNRLFNSFNKMINDLTQGELIQGNHEKLYQVENLEQILHDLTIKTYFKTASLFENGTFGVSIIFGDDELQQQSQINFGQLFGMFFQYIDDYIDMKPTSHLNKEMYKDIKDGILTLSLFVLIFQEHNVSSENAKFLIKEYSKKDKTEKEINQWIDRLNDPQVMDFVNSFLDHNLQETLNNYTKCISLNKQNKYQQLMIELIQKVDFQRNYQLIDELIILQIASLLKFHGIVKIFYT